MQGVEVGQSKEHLEPEIILPDDSAALGPANHHNFENINL